jgi:hypothetical protein
MADTSLPDLFDETETPETPSPPSIREVSLPRALAERSQPVTPTGTPPPREITLPPAEPEEDTLWGRLTRTTTELTKPSTWGMFAPDDYILRALGAAGSYVGAAAEYGAEQLMGGPGWTSLGAKIAGEVATPTIPGVGLARRLGHVPELSRTAAAASKNWLGRAATWATKGLDPKGRLGRLKDTTYDLWAETLLMRLERFSPDPEVGQNIADLLRRKSATERLWYSRHISPVLDYLEELSPAKRAQFVKELEEGTKHTDPDLLAVRAVYDQVFGPRGVVIKTAKQYNVPITPRKKFYPHELRPELARRLRTSKEARHEYAQKLVDEGAAADLTSAMELINDWRGTKHIVGTERRTPAEFAREFPKQYIKEPLEAIALRGQRLARRFAERAVFGEKDLNLLNLINQVDDRAAQRELRSIVDLAFGRHVEDRHLNEVLRGALGWAALVKLPLAGIENLTQVGLGALVTGPWNAFVGTLKGITRPGQSAQMARELGLLTDMETRQFLGDLMGYAPGRVEQAAMGFYNLSERVVRRAAAQTAWRWVEELQPLLANTSTMTPKALSSLRRELTNQLFTPDEIKTILKRRGMTPDEKRFAAHAIADEITFLPAAERRSSFYHSSPWGPVLSMFKSYLQNTAHLLKRRIGDELREGRVGAGVKLLGALGLGALVNEIPKDVAAALRGTRRPNPGTTEGLILRLIDNALSPGILGFAAEQLRVLAQGEAIALRSALGPVVPDYLNMSVNLMGLGNSLLSDTPAEAGRRGAETLRDAIRMGTPAVGPIIANRVLPPTTTSPEQWEESTLDRLGLTQHSWDLAKLREVQRDLQAQRRWSRYLYQLGWE